MWPDGLQAADKKIFCLAYQSRDKRDVQASPFANRGSGHTTWEEEEVWVESFGKQLMRQKQTSCTTCTLAIKHTGSICARWEVEAGAVTDLCQYVSI